MSKAKSKKLRAKRRSYFGAIVEDILEDVDDWSSEYGEDIYHEQLSSGFDSEVVMGKTRGQWNAHLQLREMNDRQWWPFARATGYPSLSRALYALKFAVEDELQRLTDEGVGI